MSNPVSDRPAHPPLPMNPRARLLLRTILLEMPALNWAGRQADMSDEDEFDRAAVLFVQSYQSAHTLIFEGTSRERVAAWAVTASGGITQSRDPDMADMLILTGVIRHCESHRQSDLSRAGLSATQMSELSWIRGLSPHQVSIARHIARREEGRAPARQTQTEANPTSF